MQRRLPDSLSHTWLAGSMPAVGIYPTIDGRFGGVRESLEGPTRQQAEAAAGLITANLRYPNGEPVRCVIAQTSVSNAAEAAAVAEQFRREGVGLVLNTTVCWCYSGEVICTEPGWPQAIWGFNGTDRPGAVYLNAACAAFDQIGIPVFKIYGREVQDLGDDRIPNDVATKILLFVRAGVAQAIMRGKSYLSFGGTSMGIAGSVVDPGFFHDYLGMRVVAIDMCEMFGRIAKGAFDPAEYEVLRRWIADKFRIGQDPNPEAERRTPAQLKEDWDTSAKMALIMRDCMVGNPRLRELGFPEQALGNNAILAGWQGQRQGTDHHPNGDFLEAYLTTQFGPAGPRPPFVVATENDSLNGVAMLLLYLLTGRTSIFGDMRTGWVPDSIRRVAGSCGNVDSTGLIHFLNSGPAALDGTGQQSIDGQPVIKFWWEITEEDVGACLAATEWCSSVTGYFPGGGFSTRFMTRGGMPVTLCRVNLVHGSPVLQIAEGQTVDPGAVVHNALDRRTNPTWPTTWFAPRVTNQAPFTDAWTLMEAWGCNHGAMGYGHVGPDLLTLAATLGIPVEFHNVEPDKVFRPTLWTRLGGSADPVGADFRACGMLAGSRRR